MPIDPKRLTRLRKREGLNQTQLATRAKISPRQIARIESEASSGSTARDSTVNKLAEALDVEPSVLTGEMPMPAASARSYREGGPSRQVSAWVQPDVGLAYALIKRRYGVSLTTLVNAAPLMFVLLAEGSFAWRREKLKEVREAAKRLESSGSRHMLSTFGGADRAANGASAEWQSIESRNLFGDDVLEYLVEDGFPFASTNPFAEYLSDLAAKIDDRDIVDVATDGWIPDRGALRNFPEFRICNGDVDRFTAGSERLKLALRMGFLRVDHMPEELLTDEAAEARQQWLERQIEALPEKAREVLEGLIDLDLGPSEADGDEVDS